MSNPATYMWLRPPRPERGTDVARLRSEAEGHGGVCPAHASDLRSRLDALSVALRGALTEEDIARTTTWLERHWPWTIAGSFARGGYRWVLTGGYEDAFVLVLLCEANGPMAGSLDIVVCRAEEWLPSWPRPPLLPRDCVTVSTRALPQGIHFWSHLDAGEIDTDSVLQLVKLGAAAVRDAAAGGGYSELGGATIERAHLCRRCAAVDWHPDGCPVCKASGVFRVAWGAVRKPSRTALLVLLMLALPWAGLVVASVVRFVLRRDDLSAIAVLVVFVLGAVGLVALHRHFRDRA